MDVVVPSSNLSTTGVLMVDQGGRPHVGLYLRNMPATPRALPTLALSCR